MISAPASFAAMVGGSSRVVRVRVESWLGSDLLDDSVPIASGSEETDLSLNVPERVTLTVPRTVDGDSYSPTFFDHPLAANGQRLRVLLGIDTSRGHTEWIQRGWFILQDSRADGDQISVTATGLLSLIDEAKLISPYQPTGTFGATIRGLLEPALMVDLTDAPEDRTVPASITFDENRLDAVNELLDAWPAVGRVAENGIFKIMSVDPPAVSLSLSHHDNVIRDVGASTRDGAFNCVVARGTAADGGVVQGVAYDHSGAHNFDGDFNRLPVPYFFNSPLLTTVAQCNSAAATILARLRREAAEELELEAVPDPRIQVGDRVEAESIERPATTADVQKIVLPYTAGGGSMRLGLRAT
jgi:hypothetical protein